MPLTLLFHLIWYENEDGVSSNIITWTNCHFTKIRHATWSYTDDVVYHQINDSYFGDIQDMIFQGLSDD